MHGGIHISGHHSLVYYIADIHSSNETQETTLTD